MLQAINIALNFKDSHIQTYLDLVHMKNRYDYSRDYLQKSNLFSLIIFY